MSENKRAIYENDEGVCCVIIPSPRELREGGNLEEMFTKAADGHHFEIIEATDQPSDRYFRDAWKKNVNKIDIDMPKARNIHMDKLRIKRDEKLKTLDVEWQKETERGNSKNAQDVAYIKQTLRDLPQTLDLSTVETPDELRLILPEILI